MLQRCDEGSAEGFLESENFVEVVEGVGVLFSKDAVFDEEEDDLSDMAAFGDVPVTEEGGTHGAVFLNDVFTKTF